MFDVAALPQTKCTLSHILRTHPVSGTSLANVYKVLLLAYLHNRRTLRIFLSSLLLQFLVFYYLFIFFLLLVSAFVFAFYSHSMLLAFYFWFFGFCFHSAVLFGIWLLDTIPLCAAVASAAIKVAKFGILFARKKQIFRFGSRFVEGQVALWVMTFVLGVIVCVPHYGF